MLGVVAEAVERDLLVGYLVIDIRDRTQVFSLLRSQRTIYVDEEGEAKTWVACMHNICVVCIYTLY